jgi:hypothetical protein
MIYIAAKAAISPYSNAIEPLLAVGAIDQYRLNTSTIPPQLE